MEILEQLEQRITTLLDMLDALKQENTCLAQDSTRIKEEHKQYDALVVQNNELREELAREQQKTAIALGRIESIVTRLKERT